MVARIPCARSQARFAREEYALSASTRSGLVRARPGPGAGDVDAIQHGGHLWTVAVLTGCQDEGQHSPVLVDRHVGLGRPATPGRAQLVVIRFSGNPFHAVTSGSSSVDVRSGGGRVDADLPGQLACRVRCLQQRGLDLLPDTEQLPAGEQGVDPPPRPVPVWHVPPGATRPGAIADPLDQCPHRHARGRPRRAGPGTNGSSNAHWALVRSWRAAASMVAIEDSRSAEMRRHHLRYSGSRASRLATRRNHTSHFRNRP